MGKILLRVLRNMTYGVEEKVVITDLIGMKPGYWRPDCHVHSLHKFHSFTFADGSLLVDKVYLLMSKFCMFLYRSLSSKLLAFYPVLLELLVNGLEALNSLLTVIRQVEQKLLILDTIIHLVSLVY